ncbi:hypothetical protein [Paenibacillus sp. GSMTC-2017]|nr:hypothetical protein [Paenibacillus sp. GSMTC-2017]
MRLSIAAAVVKGMPDYRAFAAKANESVNRLFSLAGLWTRMV